MKRPLYERTGFCALVVAALILVGCSSTPKPEPHKRTLAEARQIALDFFQQLDGFELLKQREVGLAGRPAVRMEASWLHSGQPRRAIIYILDHPAMFNVIHFTSPDDPDVYDAGYDVFSKMIKSIKLIDITGMMQVQKMDGEKVLRSPDLQLEIHFPSDWVYSMDDVNRALVLSGPRDSSTWLTTVSFSVINKWEPVKN